MLKIKNNNEKLNGMRIRFVEKSYNTSSGVGYYDVLDEVPVNIVNVPGLVRNRDGSCGIWLDNTSKMLGGLDEVLKA